MGRLARRAGAISPFRSCNPRIFSGPGQVSTVPERAPDMRPPPPMRPRFRLLLAADADAALERLTGGIGEPGCPVEALTAGRHVDLMIPKADRHYWSPRLAIEIAADGDTSHANGLFGPRPTVWTLFAALYSAFAFAAATGAMVGTSQWMIDRSPTGLWLIPVALLGSIGLYGASLFGQRLAADEMRLLHDYMEERLGPMIREETGAEGIRGVQASG